MAATTARIDRHGRIVIPVEYRRMLGVEPGDEVAMRLEDGELRLLSRAEAIRRAQDLVTGWTGGERSLVDELLEERRAEAARD